MKWFHLTCKWQGEEKDLTIERVDDTIVRVTCPRCGDDWPFWDDDWPDLQDRMVVWDINADDSKTRELWRMWHD